MSILDTRESSNHFIDAELSVHGDICVMNTKLFKKCLNSNDVEGVILDNKDLRGAFSRAITRNIDLYARWI